jgi:hypothetical protein
VSAVEQVRALRAPGGLPGLGAVGLRSRGFKAIHGPAVAEWGTLRVEEAPRRSCHLLPCHGAVVRRGARDLDILKGLAGPLEHRRLAGVAAHRRTATSTYFGSSSTARARRPVFSAAMMVVPDPQNGSRTTPLRLETSLIASATRATGFTVGSIASSSARLQRIHPGMRL